MIFFKIKTFFTVIIFLSSFLKLLAHDNSEQFKGLPENGAPKFNFSHQFRLGYSFFEEDYTNELILNNYSNPLYKRLENFELKRKRKPKRKYDFRYIEIGGGPAVWQESHETKMENQQKAFHLFVEYGDLQKPLSYQAGLNTSAGFIQDGYLLEPTYYFANLKYTPTRLWYFWPVWFNIYGIAGATYWQANLSNVNFGNFPSYENAIEENSGPGFLTGVGASVEWLNFSLITQFSYFFAKGKFEGGTFEKQDVYTGSAQVNVMLSYRFFLSGFQWKCPTYK
ncbi:hypothetical protein [Flexithrix dorotheae]|uniref:hypothetical protein n=1 Tax=Flexithrix dorotheae TaxID=70993 RepID=UPI00036B304F|nr:hypothetical protein [Flexithrix dorotheae]